MLPQTPIYNVSFREASGDRKELTTIARPGISRREFTKEDLPKQGQPHRGGLCAQLRTDARVPDQADGGHFRFGDLLKL